MMIVALRFLLILLLYLFLGIAFVLLWRDLHRHEVKPQPPAGAYLQIGTASPIKLRPVTTIGRARDNTLALPDPFVSAHHAVILWREEKWWIEDLDSHNGTFLNDERVAERTPLATGDRLRMGETSLRFWEG